MGSNVKYILLGLVYAYSRVQFEELYREHPDGFRVAELLGKQVIGYVVGVLGKGVGEIDSLAVDPGFQGVGVGRKLMLGTLEWFNSKNFGKASLEVSTSNDTAYRFFESLGFAKVEILKDYYGPGLDAYRMEKDLVP